MNNNKLLEDCVEYFKKNPGFSRVFLKMKKKYKSLGKIGGKIVLSNLSQQEKEALTGYFRKDYSRQKQATIRLEKFEEALQGTRFDGILLEDILKEYFLEEEIISYKQERYIYLSERKKFFGKIINQVEGRPAAKWLMDLYSNKNNAYSLLLKRYNIDSEKLKIDIYQTARALNNLPIHGGKKTRLAVFASQITKNPHAFDHGTDLDILLQYALVYQFNSEKPNNAEERAELFYNAGILINEVANYTLCYGLEAESNGEIHQGWKGFSKRKEPLLLSLKNLSSIERIVSPLDKVFVLENPAVFSSIIDSLGNDNLSLVCTSGQLKLASLLLLDMLVKEDTIIYYSGDFDPEGLGIADRLKSRYRDKLVLWRYSLPDYEKTLSKERISAKSLSKLANLKNEKLKDLAAYLKKNTMAGYQEMLIDELISDIKRELI
ncbi:TIGR02679 family protein [Natronospora cellulosivora (SeqCode)]